MDSRLLGTLFSMELPIDEKLEMIEMEYDIPIEDGIREGLETMCNLGQGIFEKGEARGEARGEAQGKAEVIKKMYEKGYSLEEITELTEKSVEEVKEIIKDMETILV